MKIVVFILFQIVWYCQTFGQLYLGFGYSKYLFYNPNVYQIKDYNATKFQPIAIGLDYKNKSRFSYNTILQSGFISNLNLNNKTYNNLKTNTLQVNVSIELLHSNSKINLGPNVGYALAYSQFWSNYGIYGLFAEYHISEKFKLLAQSNFNFNYSQNFINSIQNHIQIQYHLFSNINKVKKELNQNKITLDRVKTSKSNDSLLFKKQLEDALFYSELKRRQSIDSINKNRSINDQNLSALKKQNFILYQSLTQIEKELKVYKNENWLIFDIFYLQDDSIKKLDSIPSGLYLIINEWDKHSNYTNFDFNKDDFLLKNEFGNKRLLHYLGKIESLDSKSIEIEIDKYKITKPKFWIYNSLLSK